MTVTASLFTVLRTLAQSERAAGNDGDTLELDCYSHLGCATRCSWILVGVAFSSLGFLADSSRQDILTVAVSPAGRQAKTNCGVSPNLVVDSPGSSPYSPTNIVHRIRAVCAAIPRLHAFCSIFFCLPLATSCTTFVELTSNSDSPTVPLVPPPQIRSSCEFSSPHHAPAPFCCVSKRIFSVNSRGAAFRRAAGTTQYNAQNLKGESHGMVESCSLYRDFRRRAVHPRPVASSITPRRAQRP